MCAFIPIYEKLGPEHTIVVLASEFYNKYIIDQMEFINNAIKQNSKNLEFFNLYADSVWKYIEDLLNPELSLYIDTIIKILQGDPNLSADRNKANEYMKKVIKDEFLVTWFKVISIN